MTLPILGLVLMGLFEFSMLLFARGDVAAAARAGARVATLPGASRDTVADEVHRVLPPRMRRDFSLEVDLAEHAGEPVRVGVRVPMRLASPDLLWPIGYRLDERYLYAETRMVRE